MQAIDIRFCQCDCDSVLLHIQLKIIPTQSYLCEVPNGVGVDGLGGNFPFLLMFFYRFSHRKRANDCN